MKIIGKPVYLTFILLMIMLLVTNAHAGVQAFKSFTFNLLGLNSPQLAALK